MAEHQQDQQQRFSNEAVLSQLGDDIELWNPTRQIAGKAADVLGSKVVLLYFSARWCGPCRQFTPLLKQLYVKLKNCPQAEDFEVLFLSMDMIQSEYDAYIRTMPWWCVPFRHSAGANLASQMASCYGAQGIPHLVVLDKDGSIIKSDGCSNVSVDPDGANFPWRPKPLVQLLPRDYLLAKTTTASTSTTASRRASMADLDDKYLLLYFGASWCPPCSKFLPKLHQAHAALRKHRTDEFELLFVSLDHDAAAFERFCAKISFGAIPYEERQVKDDLVARLQIRNIPSLVMLGPRQPALTSCSIPRHPQPQHIHDNHHDHHAMDVDDDHAVPTSSSHYNYNNKGDRPVLNAFVRNVIEQCTPAAVVSAFPFQPKPFGDLNCTTDSINQFRCVIVFHESGDDDEQDDIQHALAQASGRLLQEQQQQQQNSSQLRFLWSFDATGLSKTLRDALSLGKVVDGPAPIMVLLDIPNGACFYVSAATDITVDAIVDFVHNPGQRQALR